MRQESAIAVCEREEFSNNACILYAPTGCCVRLHASARATADDVHTETPAGSFAKVQRNVTPRMATCDDGPPRFPE